MIEHAPSSRHPGGRPRSAASRRAVLDAAYAVLAGSGLAGFTVEAVALRSGVARTTIYRSWPTRGLLALDSFLEAFEPLLAFDPPAETDHASALRDLLRSLAAALDGPAGRVAASVVAEAQGDGELRRLLRERFSDPLRRRSAALLRSGVEAGAFRADLDIPVVIDAFVGASYLRLLFGVPLDPAWADALAGTLLSGCAVPAA